MARSESPWTLPLEAPQPPCICSGSVNSEPHRCTGIYFFPVNVNLRNGCQGDWGFTADCPAAAARGVGKELGGFRRATSPGTSEEFGNSRPPKSKGQNYDNRQGSGLVGPPSRAPGPRKQRPHVKDGRPPTAPDGLLMVRPTGPGDWEFSTTVAWTSEPATLLRHCFSSSQ